MYPPTTGLSFIQESILIVGAVVATLIAVFALDIWATNFLFFLGRRRSNWSSEMLREWPRVSIHLPTYNEENTISRLIDACLAMDYPKQKLEIIAVDDSTDKTTGIVESYRKKYPQQVRLIHRTSRTGFKGGALEEALKRTSADYIAVFDADTMPPKNILKALLPKIISDPGLAFVECKRSYANEESSWLTKGMSLGLDVYAFVNHQTRASAGLMTLFSGSAAIFRRKAIEEVGGWQGDTLAEDLDLSIRLKLAGWRCSYDPTFTSLEEIPRTFKSLKGQQTRWAKGYTECFRKHFVSIAKSRRMSKFQKLEALVHIGSYLAVPLTLVGTAVAVVQYIVFPLPFLVFGFLKSPIALYQLCLAVFTATAPLGSALLTVQEKGEGKFWKIARLAYITTIMFGLLISNTRAVIEGLVGVKSSFYRTPKNGDN